MAGGQEQLQAVKDYIAKHNLEDELSNAVNEAIKIDSDDPYRVIGEYLLKFAKEKDEDEDDYDDDVMAEGEEPEMPAVRGRRQQVAAKKFEAPKDWKPPDYPKDDAANAFLLETMKSNKLMKNLAPSDREQLKKAFKPVSFASGDTIIKQGDEGDKFYILYTGSSDISVTGKGSVMKATKGIAFGELALLHNAPRAATVVAEEAVEVRAAHEASPPLYTNPPSPRAHTSHTSLDFATSARAADSLPPTAVCVPRRRLSSMRPPSR